MSDTNIDKPESDWQWRQRVATQAHNLIFNNTRLDALPNTEANAPYRTAYRVGLDAAIAHMRELLEEKK